MNETSCFVKKDKTSASIGNEYIERAFSFENGHLKTECFFNKRTQPQLKFLPAVGSEEFVVGIASLFGGITEIKSSVLKVISAKQKESKDSVSLEFGFEPYSFGGNVFSFRMSVTINESDPFMKKQVFLSVADENKSKIAYIDTERFVLGSGVEQQWSHPEMDKAFVSGFHAAFGQPVYINAMFFGSEFPMNDNNIVENIARFRYYCGKKFSALKKQNGEYAAWKTVAGAARSVDFDVIRADFLEYIKTISQRTYLRTQYNSWYDHMMEITAENIVGSFFEIEKGLTQHGVEPVNAYVVDDGWNDYDNDFWSFNSKFPNELYDSSALAKKFSSQFGLWLGPRGGYNYNKKFGKHMQKAGTGGFNAQSQDICIADDNYVKNVQKVFIDFMNRFDIDYWKLDGFMLKPCKSKHHGHPTGGFKNTYCMTDCWEKWLDIFSSMREFRASQGKELWINLTCYAVPSPWFLAWVNSIWMQNSQDIGFTDKTTGGVEMNGKDFDKMLTYRDNLYFDFHKTRMYQFPNSNMYNHEPIYGNTAKIHMENDEYRKYMYMIATRGTAFWELYYSFNLFNDEMWRINYDVLRFVKENFSVLRNAKLIGQSPETGNVYGYSAWDGGEGIISLRNPLNEKKNFSVSLDRIIGVGESAVNMTIANVIPYCESVCDKKYSYGDKLEVELEPHEIVIFRFTSQTCAAPKLVSAKYVDEQNIEFVFDKHIVINENSFVSGGKALEAKLLADYSSVLVSLGRPQQSAAEIDFSVKDVYASVLSGSETVDYYENMIITDKAENPKTIKGEFTLTCVIGDMTKDTLLFAQGNEIGLSAANGVVNFDCKGVKARADADVSGKKEIKIDAVRERNGMIKIYIDGKLAGSGFDEKIINPTLEKAEIKLNPSVKQFSIKDKALAFDEV